MRNIFTRNFMDDSGDEHIIADLISLKADKVFIGSGMQKNHFIRYKTFYLIIRDTPVELAYHIKGMLYNKPEPVFDIIVHEHELVEFTSRFREDNYLIGIVTKTENTNLNDKDIFI